MSRPGRRGGGGRPRLDGRGGAKKIGLVDELGGLDRAVELARQEARIGAGGTVGLDFYPPPPSWLDLLPREARAAPPRQLWRRLSRALKPPPPACFNYRPSYPGCRPFLNAEVFD